MLDIIPPVLAAADLPEAVEFASRYPHSRWYVKKRAEALGESDMIPEEWDLPESVQAALRAVDIVLASGALPIETLTDVVRQARVQGTLDHPAIVAAVNWREWLHPRGKDGRFIEKFSWVNVFADPKEPVKSPTAKKRRGRITKLTPEGARVAYVGENGKSIPPSPAEGFPVVVPAAEIHDKIMLAPTAVARLNSPADVPQTAPEPEPEVPKRPHAEVVEALLASAEFKAWEEKTAEFNRTLDASASLNSRGEEIRKNPAHSKIDFSPATSVKDMFSIIREHQDESFSRHQQFVGETVMAARGAGLNSETALKPEGIWTVETADYINSLVDEMITELEEKGVPKSRKSLMLGGLPGAGKTTLVTNYGLNMDEWAVSNPDEVKERLIRDGVYPKIDGLSPMETAGPIHELSSHVAKIFQDRVVKAGFNMIADITMGGRPKSDGRTGAEKAADTLINSGYEVDAVFVDVPLSMSAASQNQRHLEGINELRTGKKSEGGRYVPEEILAESDIGGDRSLNRENFEKMKSEGLFSRWYLLDNTDYDTKPLLLGKGTEAGRIPKYTATPRLNDKGEKIGVNIDLKEDLADIPGMFPAVA